MLIIKRWELRSTVWAMQNEKYDLVLIRHAESEFNRAALRQMEALGIEVLKWEQLMKIEEFNKRVPYNQEYIDAPLSDFGIRQCKSVQGECEKIQADLILVSPYSRALETCSLLFGGTKSKVVVEPMLGEVFRFSCDVPGEWHKNRQRYPSFDFSKVEKFGNDWYLSNLTPELQFVVREKTREKGITCHSELRDMLVDLLRVKAVHEDPRMLRMRTSLIKKTLQEYSKKYPVIVVVAHYCVLGYLMAKEFDHEDNMVVPCAIPNCHPHYRSLHDLLRVK